MTNYPANELELTSTEAATIRRLITLGRMRYDVAAARSERMSPRMLVSLRRNGLIRRTQDHSGESFAEVTDYGRAMLAAFNGPSDNQTTTPGAHMALPQPHTAGDLHVFSTRMALRWLRRAHRLLRLLPRVRPLLV